MYKGNVDEEDAATTATLLSCCGVVVVVDGVVFVVVNIVVVVDVVVAVVFSLSLYHSAQIKRTMLQKEFSLYFEMIKTKVMTPFKAYGNLLEIKSDHRSVARFV